MLPNKLHIVMALYYYHPYTSGVSVSAKRLAECLVRRGHKVTVVTTRYDESLSQKEVIAGVTVIRTPVLFKLGKGVVSPAFNRMILKLQATADILNLHLPMAHPGLIARRLNTRKIITTYQCDINLGPSVTQRLVQWVSLRLMRKILQRSAVIIPSSLDYFEHSVFRELMSKAAEIAPSTDTGAFSPQPKRDEFRAKLGVQDGEYVVGFVGRIVFEKGISYLLRATPRLLEHIPKVKIVIAGDYKKVAGGSVKDELDQIAAQYPGVISFTGFLSDEDLVRFYGAIDVLVLPSIDPLEAFGLVQIEAMCCGTPVVASDLPGVRTIVQKTGFGVVVRRGDPEAIAAGVIQVHDTPPEATGFDPKVWDTETAADQYEAHFTRMLDTAL
jgi:glycosyltransferase involved in cell wall biosynthesis